MALFPGVTGNMGFMGKTHTGLVVSEGDAPAEKLIVSKSEGVKFQYVYGPEGNQNVVLAKGKVVELGVPEYDHATSRTWPTVKTAVADTETAVGVNAHNLYEVKRDRFSGNQPNIITRAFIEVPLFEHDVLATAEGYAQAMKFGAMYASTADALKPGDYVKVGSDGNFTKLDTTTDNPFQIVGQVWGIERELPPAGFLAYYMDMKIDELERFLKDSSYAPSPGVSGSGDAGAYPYGYPWYFEKWKTDFEKMLNPVINRGIPFLTDGYFKAKQAVTNIAIDDIYDVSTNNDGHIENVVTSGKVTFGSWDETTDTWTDAAAGTVTNEVKTDSGSRNNAIFIKLRSTLDRVEENVVVAKYKDAVSDKVKNFSAADVHIDWTNNTIVLYLEPGVVYADIVLDLKLIVDPVAGIPTEWDHKGAVGAVRILLQK